jgi:hypothetical protein
MCRSRVSSAGRVRSAADRRGVVQAARGGWPVGRRPARCSPPHSEGWGEHRARPSTAGLERGARPGGADGLTAERLEPPTAIWEPSRTGRLPGCAMEFVLASVPVSSERAEQRRRTWSGGVAQSFEQLEQLDLDAWLAQTAAQRVSFVWSLVEDSLSLRGQHGPTPRLSRSTGGVRPLRG